MLAIAAVVWLGCGSESGDPVGPNSVAGTWAGSTTQDREIEFVVAGGNVAVGTFSFALTADGCSGAAGAVVIQGGESVPIVDGEFVVPRTQIGQDTFLRAEGEFESASTATGTFTVEDRGCVVTIGWIASRQ